MTDTLTTIEEAKELLGVEDFHELVSEGTVRRVTHAGETYVLGADVARALKDKDPKYLARLVGRAGGAVSADPDNLAADIPRL